MCSQNIHIHTKKMKLFLKKTLGDGIVIVTDTYNSSTEETEMGDCCVFKASLGCVVSFRPAQTIE